MAAGTHRYRSPGSRPPCHAGTRTARSPTSPVSRVTARAARSSAAERPPHRPSWSPSSPRTSSGTSRRRTTPPVSPPGWLAQPSSCQRTRSTIAGADIPAARYQARSHRSPCSVSAVTTSRVHTRPSATSAGDEPIGEVLADEHQRVELGDRIVEAVLDAALGGRIGGVGRAVVGPARQAMGMTTGRAEPGQDVARRESGEITEAGQPEPGEQPDQLGVDLAHLGQPGDRQRGEEVRRTAGATTTGWRAARRAATAEVNLPSAMPTCALVTVSVGGQPIS